jgi:hypothetical protein
MEPDGAQVLIQPGWESIPGLPNRFTNTGSRKVRTGSLDWITGRRIY